MACVDNYLEQSAEVEQMLKEELLENLKVLFSWLTPYLSLILYFLSIRLKGDA